MTIHRPFFLIVFAVMVVTIANAQTINSGTQGNNAVWADSTHISGSSAYIDASAFYTSGGNVLCTILNNILTSASGYPPYPAAGAVIDARGIPSPQTCTTSPFAGVTVPSTILLPRGKITISTTWVLPDHTRLIGAGRTETNIAPSSPFTAATMLQMCPGPSPCTGISVSDLQLNADCGCSSDPGVFDGIDNFNSGDSSYVSNVNLHYLEGTSLNIETSGANNSGPYTDLNITMGGSGCTSCFPKLATACIEIKNASTRGIHGLTCTSNGTPTAGVYLDGNSNRIEQGHFEGVVDGIRVGANASASANVIANMSGATGGTTSGALTNVVHICNSVSSCGSTNVVSDLTLLQIANYYTNSVATRASIVDDITGVQLGNTTDDWGVALYALGEPLGTIGYSRFSTATEPSSTSPVPVPSWGVGALGATTAPSGTCSSGTIFSNTNGTAGHALWLCVGGAWKNVK